MKKKVLILAIAVLTAFAILSLAACNLVQVTGGDASISDDYNADTTQRNVNNIRTTGGYRITYRLTTESSDESSENTNDTLTLAAKNDVYYVKNSNVSEQYVDLSNEEYASVYTKGEDGWTLTIKAYDEDYTKADAKEAFTAFESYFIMYATLDEGLEKSSATVAGRACDKYSWGVSVNFIVSASAKSECYIDKETGICLKWTANASASGIGVDSGSGSANFECTEFIIGFTPTLPTGNEIVETVDLRVDLNGDGGDEDEGGEVIGDDEDEGEGEGAGGNGNVSGGEGGNGAETGVDDQGNVIGGGETTYSINRDVPAIRNTDTTVRTLVAEGVSFTFQAYGESCGYAAKGNVYYMKEGDYETYIVLDREGYDKFTKNGSDPWEKEALEYGYEYADISDAIGQLNDILKSVLFDETLDGTFLTASTTTRESVNYIGAAAYRYTYNLEYGITMSITVEKTNGIILDWTLTEDGDTSGFSLTSLATTGVNLRLPEVE